MRSWATRRFPCLFLHLGPLDSGWPGVDVQGQEVERCLPSCPLGKGRMLSGWLNQEWNLLIYQEDRQSVPPLEV